MKLFIWIVEHGLSIAVIPWIVILHPELRRALEYLGTRSFISGVLPFQDAAEERFSNTWVFDLAKACFKMDKVNTGALMVIEQKVLLTEYERTGVEVDALISSHLIINIFEHNTPILNGSVIIRGYIIVTSPCYLPLSDNMEISKELGTRHRAVVLISDPTDALTIIESD